MLKVGITGQLGFVGTHLYNTIRLFPEEFILIEFHKQYFEDENKLNTFVAECDVIVHLAAMNRHNDPQVIYDTNLGLVRKLVQSLKVTNSKSHVLFSSSTQEERDNLYGKSKKEGRELMINWSNNSQGKFTGMIIPN
jgi:UDP-2-acetamido-2,6-beta-L-arabino-hexul-4-ose reductase